MKVEARVFGFGVPFFVIVAFVYGFMTDWKEWVGFPALLLTGLLAGLIAFYLNLTGRQVDPRPEDDPNARISDLYGEMGEFAPQVVVAVAPRLRCRHRVHGPGGRLVADVHRLRGQCGGHRRVGLRVLSGRARPLTWSVSRIIAVPRRHNEPVIHRFMGRRAASILLVSCLAGVPLVACEAATGGPGAAEQAPTPGASAGRSTVAGVSTEVTPQTVLSVAPASGATDVRPDRPVTVSLVGGELTEVSLVDGADKEVDGEVDQTGTWRNTGPLTPGSLYTVRAAARGDDGATVRTISTFSTAKAARTISSTLIPGDDWVVGVGMPVIVVFSSAVTNREAAERALSVTSTPAVTGGWHWFSSTEVHWRPVKYWPAGTKVTVRSETTGVELADGAWGRRAVTTNYTIGSAQFLTVDIAKHSVSVKRDGKVLKTLPVTTGKPGFATRNGVKVIMDKERRVQMDAATTGVDSTDPDYYNLDVEYAMRLTWSGEYFHAAPWSVGSQGRANVSHGCTGLSTANAKWLYDNTKIGDVAVFKNGSRSLEWGNGYTDWNLSFAKYDAKA